MSVKIFLQIETVSTFFTKVIIRINLYEKKYTKLSGRT